MDAIWKKASNLITWKKKFYKLYKENKNGTYKWFPGGMLNASYNCLNRHLNTEIELKTALYFVRNNGKIVNYTYKDLYYAVENFSDFLNSFLNKKKNKTKKVAIYLPASRESIISMLSCAKIGACHAVIFDGLSKEAISRRINLFKPDIIITKTDENAGENRITHLKKAITMCEKKNSPNLILVIDDIKKINKHNKVVRIFLDAIFEKRKSYPKINSFLSSHPFFVLFTSGSTAEPKGVLHSLGGYLTYAAYTSKEVFNLSSKETMLCASDAGWINGHTYSVYGPFTLGASTVILENLELLTHPDFLFNTIINTKTTIFYSSATLIRVLRSHGHLHINDYKNSKIKTIGSMGEHLASSVGKWFSKEFNMKDKSVINTYFQTETGGVMCSPTYKDNIKDVPIGSIGKPLKGIKISIKKFVNEDNIRKKGEVMIDKPWPGCMNNIINSKEIFKSYWSDSKKFRMFDYGSLDKKKNLKVHGRVDDVISISGHRIGTEEIESCCLELKEILEACAVSIEDKLAGEKLYLFVKTKSSSKKLSKKIDEHLQSQLTKYHVPYKTYFLNDLPKTRSGKIMRRLVKDILNKKSDIGDISTLANPHSIGLIKKLI